MTALYTSREGEVLRVSILAVHEDMDSDEPVYTIGLPDGKERQTEAERLRPAQPTLDHQDTAEALPKQRAPMGMAVDVDGEGGEGGGAGEGVGVSPKRAREAGEAEAAGGGGAPLSSSLHPSKMAKKVDGKLVAKATRAIMRKAQERNEDPASISRKALRIALEDKLGVLDLSEYKETIKDAAVEFVLAMSAAA